MKPILILLLLTASLQGFAQVTSKWRGNTPGHEHDWNYASNWSNNRVPDEFTDVIIPLDIALRYSYPVIQSGYVEINSLHVWPGAILTIVNGEIHILDAERSNYHRHQIIGKGKVRLEIFSSDEFTHVADKKIPDPK